MRVHAIAIMLVALLCAGLVAAKKAARPTYRKQSSTYAWGQDVQMTTDQYRAWCQANLCLGKYSAADHEQQLKRYDVEHIVGDKNGGSYHPDNYGTVVTPQHILSTSSPTPKLTPAPC